MSSHFNIKMHFYVHVFAIQVYRCLMFPFASAQEAQRCIFYSFNFFYFHLIPASPFAFNRPSRFTQKFFKRIISTPQKKNSSFLFLTGSAGRKQIYALVNVSRFKNFFSCICDRISKGQQKIVFIEKKFVAKSKLTGECSKMLIHFFFEVFRRFSAVLFTHKNFLISDEIFTQWTFLFAFQNTKHTLIIESNGILCNLFFSHR